MESLAHLLEDGISRGWHPGGQLVVHERGRTRIDLACGTAAPGVGVSGGTVLLWMSAGKPLLAAGLALLQSRGLLEWDDPVVKFLPAFAAHGKEAFTLRHLLEHRAGFRTADAGRHPDWAAQVAAVCAARREPDWEPGARQGYHTVGSWTVLGAVAEAVTGEPVGDWLRREVFLPLGMKSTWTGLPLEADGWVPGAFAPMAECAGGFCGPHPFWSQPAHLHARWPGSNTFSTAQDMARFYAALLDGGRGVIPEVFVRELLQAKPEARMDATFRRPMRFHLGFLFDSKQEGESWHSYGYGAAAGPRTFGHGGNQCAVAFADPDRELVVAAAFNGMPGELAHQQRMRGLLAAVEALRAEE